jgi:hypothetical protein
LRRSWPPLEAASPNWRRADGSPSGEPGRLRERPDLAGSHSRERCRCRAPRAALADLLPVPVCSSPSSPEGALAHGPVRRCFMPTCGVAAWGSRCGVHGHRSRPRAPAGGVQTDRHRVNEDVCEGDQTRRDRTAASAVGDLHRALRWLTCRPSAHRLPLLKARSPMGQCAAVSWRPAALPPGGRVALRPGRRSGPLANAFVVDAKLRRPTSSTARTARPLRSAQPRATSVPCTACCAC